MTVQNVISAFHLMWDNYPEFAILLHKDKVIVAVNKEGEKLGLAIGAKCQDCLPEEVHKDCKVPEVIQTRNWAYRRRQQEKGSLIHFWVPVEKYDDYMIHFQVGGAVEFLCEDCPNKKVSVEKN